MIRREPVAGTFGHRREGDLEMAAKALGIEKRGAQTVLRDLLLQHRNAFPDCGQFAAKRHEFVVVRRDEFRKSNGVEKALRNP